MKITWHGHSCFKIVTNNTVIVTDPFGKNIGLKPIRCEADIVTVSHEHYDHNNVSVLRGSPFIINEPGEYELKGVVIRGINSFRDKKQGEEKGLSTLFVIGAEGIRICHLGDLGQKELTGEQLESLGDVDILLIPVGGIYTVDGEEAVKIINQIEPKIVIPMHYKIPNLTIKLQGVDNFLKEIGREKQIVERLVIKKKDLPKEEIRVIVMKIA